MTDKITLVILDLDGKARAVPVPSAYTARLLLTALTGKLGLSTTVDYELIHTDSGQPLPMDTQMGALNLANNTVLAIRVRSHTPAIYNPAAVAMTKSSPPMQSTSAVSMPMSPYAAKRPRTKSRLGPILPIGAAVVVVAVASAVALWFWRDSLDLYDYGDSGNSRFAAQVVPSGSTLRSGSVVRGTITDDNEEVRYTVQLDQGSTVVVDMIADDSGDLDTYLRLLSPSGSTLETDDDGGNDTNSRLEYRADSTGIYTIVATNYSGEGPYTLSVSISGGSSSTDLEVGDSVRGYISNSSPEVSYTVYLYTGQYVVIDLIADSNSSMDTYLELWGPSGGLVDSDDDSGTDLNSQIGYEATTSGIYTIIATRYDSDEGGFTLAID